MPQWSICIEAKLGLLLKQDNIQFDPYSNVSREVGSSPSPATKSEDKSDKNVSAINRCWSE
jgi:hypothetical protein